MIYIQIGSVDKIRVSVINKKILTGIFTMLCERRLAEDWLRLFANPFFYTGHMTNLRNYKISWSLYHWRKRAESRSVVKQKMMIYFLSYETVTGNKNTKRRHYVKFNVVIRWCNRLRVVEILGKICTMFQQLFAVYFFLTVYSERNLI